MKRLLLITGFALATFTANSQQTSPAKTSFWLQAELGTGTYRLHAAAEAGVSIREHIVGLQLDFNDNIDKGRSSYYEASCIGALYGRKITHGRYAYLIASAGLGMSYFETRGDYLQVQGIGSYGPDKTAWRPALPVQLRLWANPLPVLGFTLTGGAVFTTRQTFLHAGLGVAIGKLRHISFR